MDLDTLYKYLKLVVPNEFKVVRKEFGINVGVGDVNTIYGAVFSDSYSIRNNYIVLSRLNNNIPEYAQRIFGKPALINHGYLAYYTFFNIPEELREDLNESVES